VQSFTLGATTSFSFTNTNAGGTYILVVKQHPSNLYSVTWPVSVTWVNGATPSMTAITDKYDVYTFLYDGAKYFGTYSQNFT
jgi:hypothetical protein